ncbi:hypothetical protein HETIRDRAFT_103395 [Heterobasidion irregulare TC 32-1]|uniref:Uncharacterized protein n=1 Tax=Heterobasidion irregulare (strain TC 32-1) TaxID=747525 RepID=W4K2W9_HETIT|nr:uncharacterized protein HETIRDRAFT_103395 [Heterobasidion irregulare TC 32-1]ETW80079.1 hypothetical protein HETIRDRAFT_103395 [Heterobasidion irregulare TC 32-1]
MNLSDIILVRSQQASRFSPSLGSRELIYASGADKQRVREADQRRLSTAVFLPKSTECAYSPTSPGGLSTSSAPSALIPHDKHSQSAYGTWTYLDHAEGELVSKRAHSGPDLPPFAWPLTLRRANPALIWARIVKALAPVLGRASRADSRQNLLRFSIGR